jgi:Domain of unknown function (DUF4260)
MSPKPLLHLEGAAVLITSIFAYHRENGSWLLFAILFLAPDLSMAGYFAGPRLGAFTYNAIHTYLGPFVLAGYSILTGHQEPLWVATIWIAHIGFDRMLGFGLKYPTNFKDTHLAPGRHTV